MIKTEIIIIHYTCQLFDYFKENIKNLINEILKNFMT